MQLFPQARIVKDPEFWPGRVLTILSLEVRSTDHLFRYSIGRWPEFRNIYQTGHRSRIIFLYVLWRACPASVQGQRDRRITGNHLRQKRYRKLAINKYHHHLVAGAPNKAVPYRVLEELFLVKKAVDPGAILVYHKDKILPIALSNIAFFYLKNGVVHLTTFDKKNFFINKNMEELGVLAEPLFFRANRQFLVNRKAVVDASSYLSRKLSVTLCVPTEESITISKEKMTQFLDWLTKS